MRTRSDGSVPSGTLPSRPLAPSRTPGFKPPPRLGVSAEVGSIETLLARRIGFRVSSRESRRWTPATARVSRFRPRLQRSYRTEAESSGLAHRGLGQRTLQPADRPRGVRTSPSGTVRLESRPRDERDRGPGLGRRGSSILGHSGVPGAISLPRSRGLGGRAAGGVPQARERRRARSIPRLRVEQRQILM